MVQGDMSLRAVGLWVHPEGHTSAGRRNINLYEPRTDRVQTMEDKVRSVQEKL